MATVKTGWEAEQEKRLGAAQASWKAEQEQRLATAREAWQAEAQEELGAARQAWQTEIDARLARAEADWTAKWRAESSRNEARSAQSASHGGADKTGAAAEQAWNEPDPGAIAREAIEEVKRETEEARLALEQRRHQAKLEGRRVTDKRHRKVALGMKKTAARFEIKRPRRKLAMAFAGLGMVGAAAFIGSRDLSFLEQWLDEIRPAVT